MLQFSDWVAGALYNLQMKRMNMWRHILQILVIVLAITDVTIFGLPGSYIPADIRSEEYAVCSMVINKILIETNSRLLVIQQDTLFDAGYKNIPEENTQSAGKFLAPVSQSALRDFVQKHSTSYQFSNSFTINGSYALATRQEIESCFGNDENGWWNFYNKYKGADGYMVLSRVGFNPEMNQAFVRFEFHGEWGRVCSQGADVVLTKERGEWKVQKKYISWIT